MYKEFRLCLLSGLLLMIFSSLVAATTSEESFETVHTSNAAVFNRLGMTRLQIPDGHHKKRLAGPEPPGLSSQTRIHQPYSRRHGHRDSHVYIVKLPASPPYYTITKPHKSINDDKVTKTGPSFPVGFQGNGKPAKIYHWNLPVKKITEKRLQLSQLRIDQTRKKLEDMKKRQQTSSTKTILNKLYPLDTSSSKSYEYRAADNKLYSHQKPPVTKHIRNNDKRLSYSNYDNDNIKFKSTKKNDIGNKAYRLDDFNVHRIHLTNELHGSRNTVPKMKKHRKKAATSYYAPIATKTGSTSIHKNFPGNGKPKAFYVMEKSRKPVYYHPLLP
ncbi:PREDICTED: uncharacterized protein LOC105450844 isoform X2 [Wasmannia auropunctata]|uniref:uncharacterized protein LOC105450844 isoform X2 n=1 Tax=Wasmannia auropunctata TaxID=64793 RepID=UPI0005F01739|nr:PREDICTED: uncharacterized protein LOC105450844 isoform X2 [Wasmannia auropunctata]